MDRGARPAAQLCRQRQRGQFRQQRGARLCRLCAGAQWPPGRRRSCAISPTPGSTPSKLLWREPSSRRLCRCWEIAAAPKRLSRRRRRRCKKTKATPFSRADFGSLLRDGAGVLTLASESNADRAVIVKAAQVVESESAATPYASTQEESWMVLAAQAMAAQASDAKSDHRRRAAGRAFFRRALDGAALASKPVTIGNQGQTPVRVADHRLRPSDPAGARGRARLPDRAQFLSPRRDAGRAQRHPAERAAGRGAESHRAGGGLCAADPRRQPASGTGDRQSRPVRRRFGRRARLGQGRGRRRPIPNTRTTVSSPPSSATARTRRRSLSPMSFAPSVPATMCCRRRPSRTCTAPSALAAPALARWRFRGSARRSEPSSSSREPAWLYAAIADRLPRPRHPRRLARISSAPSARWICRRWSAPRPSRSIATAELLRAFDTPDGRWRLPAPQGRRRPAVFRPVQSL